MYRLIKPFIDVVAYVATITGFVCIFLKDTVATLVALGVFCLLLLGIAIAIFVFVWKHLKRTTNYGHIGFSTFVKYETEPDGKHIVFEVFRQIQSKQLVMTDLDYSFKWTGSKSPRITSKLQNTDGRIYEGEEGAYDHIKLKFKKALTYNETGTVHFYAELDDVDGISKPCVEFKVDVPVEIIHYRIILKQKPNDYHNPAVLRRRKINNQIGNIDYEDIESVAFNAHCKSYEYHLLEPEVGYFYRIEWQK
ncbi:MAG: hypothetical protein LBO74_06635 [Candidatus Symbiothrix sp.]|jgi:hypothetical protein|nr:hypothetical protein [Candidatus Symbiothrix sp.]